MSTNGPFQLGSTIGEPAAGNIGGGTFTLGSGLWGAVGTPCLLDVDGDGNPDVATDLVYIARRLLGLGPVPQSFRQTDPTIASDAVITSAIAALGTSLDVDADGSVDVATDVVYVARRLLGLSPVPASFRTADPTISSDSEIAARIDALCTF